MSPSATLAREADMLGVTLIPCSVLAAVDPSEGQRAILFLPAELDDRQICQVEGWLNFVESAVA